MTGQAKTSVQKAPSQVALRKAYLKGGIRTLPHNLGLDIKRNKVVYLLLAMILSYFVIFHYAPMFGLLMAFQRYTPAKGILGSKWIGLKNFVDFFTGPYAGRLIRNTVAIGTLDLVINFPTPIIFALILNEVKQKFFKKAVQTISYMPYFISAVVVCGLVIEFTKAGGPISTIVAQLGDGKQTNLINQKGNFWLIYVLQNMWQGLGYGSIIYLAALSSVDQELYEAAHVDGAGKWRQLLHVTIPGIMPIIIMMLILRLGAIFSVGAEKILLLYSPANYAYSDVINTYVFRMGITQSDYGLSTAVGLFNSLIGTLMLVSTNALAKRVSSISMF